MNDCNQLGVWLWHVERTGFTHDILAYNLASADVKRVYVKVADGRVNPTRWTELVDRELVDTYRAAGVSPWAWSYNYTDNYEEQARAVYMAAETGYDGFVVDVEMEFDGKAQELEQLFAAFHDSKLQAIADGYADEDFSLYVTTWGNPKDHNFSITSMDPYVDGYMPQTYVEYWGTSYVNNITYWIQEGNREYKELGATKPIHHIASTATGVMTPELIDEFIAASGPETSLWRVPGGGVDFSVWEDWNQVDWNKDFCESTSIVPVQSSPLLYPNPFRESLFIGDYSNSSYRLYNLMGELVMKLEKGWNYNLEALPAGSYILKFNSKATPQLVIKQ